MPKEHELDQLLINGGTAWGVVPGGLLASVARPTPIHLYRGNNEWGYHHIGYRHSNNNLFKCTSSIEETIWDRLCQPGEVHLAEQTDRLTITVTFAPSAFVVLKHMPSLTCFSIITMYSKRNATTKQLVGQYVGSPRTLGRNIYGWEYHQP